jgi:trigger factor
MPNEVQTAPQITLGQYKALPVTRHIRPVSEGTVQHEVVHQCRVHATYIPTDAPAKRGNKVVLDFEGFFDETPIPDSRMEQVEVLLGTGKLMPAAEQAVYGHCAGEAFSFDFTYPEDFRVAELSGKTAQFHITLHTVAVQTIPTADDDFARSLGYDSLSAMTDTIRAEKVALHNTSADRKASAELLDQAGANLTVELPNAALEKTAQTEMDRLRARLAKSGITLESYCKSSKTTEAALFEQYRAEAERRLRNILAVRAISEAENIVATNTEVDEEYARLSKLHGTPEAEIRRVLPVDSIAAAVLTRKVQAFLLANAVVTNVMDEARNS